MLVKELIKELEKYDSNLEVYYESDKGCTTGGQYYEDVWWPWLAEKVVLVNRTPEKNEPRKVTQFILIRKIWEADDEEEGRYKTKDCLWDIEDE